MAVFYDDITQVNICFCNRFAWNDDNF